MLSTRAALSARSGGAALGSARGRHQHLHPAAAPSARRPCVLRWLAGSLLALLLAGCAGVSALAWAQCAPGGPAGGDARLLAELQARGVAAAPADAAAALAVVAAAIAAVHADAFLASADPVALADALARELSPLPRGLDSGQQHDDGEAGAWQPHPPGGGRVVADGTHSGEAVLARVKLRLAREAGERGWQPVTGAAAAGRVGAARAGGGAAAPPPLPPSGPAVVPAAPGAVGPPAPGNASNGDLSGGGSDRAANLVDLRDGRDAVDGRFSHQTCYQDGDESELCVFSGTVCFAGNDPALVAADAPHVGPTNPLHDPSGDCIDYRHTEVSSWTYTSCRYDQSGNRPFDAVGAAAHRRALDTPIDVTTRYLGPANRRDVAVHLLTPQHVFPDVRAGWASVAAGRRRGAAFAARADDVKPGDPTHIVPPDAGGVGADGSFDHPAVPGLRVAARVRSAAGGLVDFVDGALWMVPINSRAYANPYMFMAGASKLWAARRNNATHPAPGQAGPRRPAAAVRLAEAADAAGVGGVVSGRDDDGDDDDAERELAVGAATGVGFGAHPMDGYVHGVPPPGVPAARYYGRMRSVHRARRVSAGARGGGGHARPTTASASRSSAAWVVGPQWGPLPPMDTVVFLGIGGQDITHTGNLTAWLRGALGLMTQPHTRTFFADLRRHYRKEHLLCAATGVWGSQRPRVFSSHADVWAFRQRAYEAAGVTRASHPAHPPRTITVLDRRGQHGRSYFNRDDVLQATAATGVRVRVIDAMHELSFEAQVAAMAGTGVLIAPHGAALMNLVFLPAHAAVIEVFSPLMKNDVYRRLAASVGVRYVSLHSRHVLPGALHQYSGVQIIHNKSEFVSSCVGNNASSYDGMLLAYCNRASKGHPIVVPQRALRRALDDALDAIGARSAGGDSQQQQQRSSSDDPAWGPPSSAAETAGEGGEGGARRMAGGPARRTQGRGGSSSAIGRGSAHGEPAPHHWYIGTDPDVEALPPAEPGVAQGRGGLEAVYEFRAAMAAAAVVSSVEPASAPTAARAFADGAWRPGPETDDDLKGLERWE